MSERNTAAKALPDPIFAVISKTDTPTLSNAIELTGVRDHTEGFCDRSVRCLFPELGFMCGYAVTAEVKTITSEEGGFVRTMAPLIRALAASPKPALVVMQEAGGQTDLSAHCGEVMATTFQRLGGVGVVSDSCVRDIKEVRGLKFHYFARGAVASHARFHISRVGVPVVVGGLQILPGDLLHGDVNGLIKVPSEGVEKLPSLIEQVLARERAFLEYVTGEDFDLDGLIDRFAH